MQSAQPFHEVRRAHVADDVFDQLAAAILRGEITPGSLLPPERVLVERFGVSRVIARQAVHRLAELGLVRVKQGGATIVLDPADVTDLGVLALFYRFAPRGGSPFLDAADMIEKQYLQGLSIVEVASRRASRAALAGILASIDAEARDAEGDVDAFEERFWRALAAAGKNRIFTMEVGWWYRTLKDRPVPPRIAATPARVRIAFFRELARRLVDRDDPVGHYLSMMHAVLAPPVQRTAKKPRQGAQR